MRSLFSARFLLGLGEAGAFPVASRGMQLWFPRSERGRIQGTTHFFSRFAVAVTPLVAGSILLAFGWRAIFYIFGSLGVIWAVAFALIYRNRPEEHRGVNQGELAQIRGRNADGTIVQLSTVRQPVPWGRIFSSPNMWFIAIGYACFFFGTNFYLTWYPTYLREYRHLTLQALGILGSVPLFAGMLGDVVGGSISDLVYKRTGNAKVRAPRSGRARLCAGRCLRDSRRHDRERRDLRALPGPVVLLSRIGDRTSLGRPHGRRRPVQRHRHRHHEHGRRLGRFFDCAGLRRPLRQRLLVGPFFVSAGVLFLGALIWIFLIDPEKSVVA